MQITQNGAKTGLSGKIPKKWQFTMRTDCLSAVLPVYSVKRDQLDWSLCSIHSQVSLNWGSYLLSLWLFVPQNYIPF